MSTYPGGVGGHGIYSNMQSVPGLPQDFDLSLHGHHQHQQQPHHPPYDFQGDLDLFTNTQFFDFDMADVPETQSPTSEGTAHWPLSAATSNNNAGPMGTVDYLNGGDLQPIHNYFPNIDSASSSRNPSIYPQPTLPSSQQYNASSIASPNSSTPSNQAGEKRKAEATVDSAGGSSNTTPAANSLEEASRAAAEEDKRRRNTAASARFRVKKKQREQALEKSAKEMTDRVNYLEQRVSTLEMENKLLKNLITEKSGQEVNVAELTNKISATAQEAAATTSVNLDTKLETSDKSKKEVKIEKAQEKQR